MASRDDELLEKPKAHDLDSGNEHRNRRIQLIIAIITALGAIIVALIYVRPWSHPNPCSTNLTITTPDDGTSIANGAKGVEVTGEACGMNGRTAWLFDYDPNDQYYYFDYNTSSPSPVTNTNGGWAFVDQPVGNPGDVNQMYQITVVLASPACTNVLERIKPYAPESYRIKTFPAGCQVEDDTQVVVTYPQHGA